MSAVPVVGYLLHCQDTSSVAEGFQCSATGHRLQRDGISADALSCSCQAAPGQCHGGAVMCVPQRTADTAHEKKAQHLLENTSNGSVLRLSAWQGGIRLLEIVHSIAYLALWPPENLNFFSQQDPKSLEHQYTYTVIMDRKREFKKRCFNKFRNPTNKSL